MKKGNILNKMTFDMEDFPAGSDGKQYAMWKCFPVNDGKQYAVWKCSPVNDGK